jgi:anti-anti-sigma factor
LVDREGRTTAVELLSIEETRSLRLVGELDMSSAQELEEALGSAIERGGPVLIDLGEVTFMDSTGISALLKAAYALRGRGCLILHGEQENVRRVLDLVRLDGSLPNLHRVSDHRDRLGVPASDSVTAIPAT